MKNRYRAALIGLGNIAWRFDQRIGGRHLGLTHVSAYMQNDRIEIVGGCSPDEEDCESFKKAFNVPVYKTVEEMMENLGPDIVSICSPQQLHFEHIMHCFKRGVSMVWLEKPPAGSLRELDELLQEAKRQNGKTKVLVNYQRRYTENYEYLRNLYRERTFGKCRYIHATYSRGLETNGSHVLDILFFIIGDDRQYDLEEIGIFNDAGNPSFSLTFDGGPSVTISGMDLPYHCIDISLICDLGRISVLYGGMKTLIENKVGHEFFPGFFRLRENNRCIPGQESFCSSMKRALEDLIVSFEKGHEPKSTLVTSRNTQALIEKVKHR